MRERAGATWLSVHGITLPAVTILGDVVSSATLFTTGPIGQDKGWPVFGSGSSLTEFGQPWNTGPAVPFSVSPSWRIDQIQVGLFGPTT